MDLSVPRHAVVLSGGGAHGAYEVGVLQALLHGECPATAQTPVDPQIVTGTSVGGFNAAALLGSRKPTLARAADALAALWLDQIADRHDGCGNAVYRYRADPLAAFGPGCAGERSSAGISAFIQEATSLAVDLVGRSTAFVQSTSAAGQRALELLDVETFLSFEPFARTIQSHVDVALIRDGNRQLRLAATNWRTGQLRLFGNTDMTPNRGAAVIRATGAIPGICHSVDIDGEPYVDGGVVMNTPLKPAIDLGADVLHVVYVDPDVSTIALPRVRNTVSTLYRTLVIGFGAVVNQDIRLTDRANRSIRKRRAARIAATGSLPTHIDSADDGIEYRPLTIHRYYPRGEVGGGFGWLEFDREYVDFLIQEGRSDAREHDCEENGCVIPS